MARCYSDAMRPRQPLRSGSLPSLWLVSDARNDAGLEAALRRLPRGSGLVFRHYHLDRAPRRARFLALARVARALGHLVVLSGTARQARRWGADGAYGPPEALARGPACLRLVTVHGLREIAKSRRADALILSPVYATRSHPGARGLGPLRFRLMAAQAPHPVLALGGMTLRSARSLRPDGWAAIDGLSP
ncbi:MAG: thiamine phosphate synthase [Novosphingobium sp.]